MKVKMICGSMLAVIALAFSACTPQEKETPSGLKFKVIKAGDGVVGKKGQVVAMNYKLTDSKDSVWGDTFKDGAPGAVPIYDSSNMATEGGMLQMFRMVSKGDSISVKMTVREFFKELGYPSTPPNIDRAKIQHIMEQEYEKALQAIEDKYRTQLLTKDEKLEQYRRENANIWTIAKLMAGRPINVENRAVAGTEAFNTDLRGANVGNVANKVQDNARQQANQYNYTSEQQQTLAEAAAEIQELLDQLSRSYPKSTRGDQMTIAAEAIKQIEDDPSLMKRILKALKAGGVSALEQFLNHPAASFVIAALEDWQSTNETSAS